MDQAQNFVLFVFNFVQTQSIPSFCNSLNPFLSKNPTSLLHSVAPLKNFTYIYLIPSVRSFYRCTVARSFTLNCMNTFHCLD